jgi:glycerol uptake facilitator-like aquaporin
MSTPVTTPQGTVHTRSPRNKLSDVREFLVSFIIGFGIWTVISVGPGNHNTRYVIATGFAVFAFFAVLVSNPDNHGNTLGSIGAAFSRLYGFRLRDLPFRFLEQFLGFLLATLLAWATYGDAKTDRAHYGAAIPMNDVSWWSHFWTAFWYGLLFTLAFLYIMDRIRLKVLRALLIGLALGFAVYASLPSAGGGMNIARELAPDLFIRDVFWSVVFGELLAAVLAGILYHPFADHRDPYVRVSRVRRVR